SFEPTSIETLEALERLYCADHHWRAAVDVYGRHAACAAPPERARIFLEVGRLYEREIGDLFPAHGYFEKAAAGLPYVGGAVEALPRLYERVGSHERAARVLERRAAQADTPAGRAALHHQAGALLMARLGVGRAVTSFERALAEDPT